MAPKRRPAAARDVLSKESSPEAFAVFLVSNCEVYKKPSGLQCSKIAAAAFKALSSEDLERYRQEQKYKPNNQGGAFGVMLRERQAEFNEKAEKTTDTHGAWTAWADMGSSEKAKYERQWEALQDVGAVISECYAAASSSKASLNEEALRKTFAVAVDVARENTGVKSMSIEQSHPSDDEEEEAAPAKEKKVSKLPAKVGKQGACSGMDVEHPCKYSLKEPGKPAPKVRGRCAFCDVDRLPALAGTKRGKQILRNALCIFGEKDEDVRQEALGHLRRYLAKDLVNQLQDNLQCQGAPGQPCVFSRATPGQPVSFLALGKSQCLFCDTSHVENLSQRAKGHVFQSLARFDQCNQIVLDQALAKLPANIVEEWRQKRSVDKWRQKWGYKSLAYGGQRKWEMPPMPKRTIRKP